MAVKREKLSQSRVTFVDKKKTIFCRLQVTLYLHGVNYHFTREATCFSIK
jgi:hypothetical protein